MSPFARFVVASLCLSLAYTGSATEAEHNKRSLLAAKSREVKAAAAAAEVVTGRELYIDPNAKPTSTSGWNCIVSVICAGKFSTVNNIKLRTALQKLGFPTNSQSMQFGGNAATTNWRSITAFVINIPYAGTSGAAIQAVKAKVTVKALNTLANLPKANPVKQILFTAFKA